MNSSFHRACDIVFLGDVGDGVVDLTALIGQIRHDSLAARLGPSTNCDDGTLGGEARGTGFADAGPSIGDQDPYPLFSFAEQALRRFPSPFYREICETGRLTLE